MKVIALLPVKNEAWVIGHTLASLSGFCDVILINDQRSTDRTREIAAQFPKAVWIESSESKICEQARWQLWDVARDYEGSNLLWCTDADELVAPALVSAFMNERAADLTPGAVVDCLYCHLWNGPARYRAGLGGAYAPYLKPVAIVDDRRTNYDRSRALPLHQERVPIVAGAPRLSADQVPVLHLQWLLPNRSQIRQAWYRCRELMQGERTAVDINETYAHTLPEWYAPTAAVPPLWLEAVTLPDTSVDSQPTWQEADILEWFDARGVEFFEPLEIWHVPALRREFRRRTGRGPRPDRSYLPPRLVRARAFGRRVFHAARRRIVR